MPDGLPGVGAEALASREAPGMRAPAPAEEVGAWLWGHGWRPDRYDGAGAERLIGARVRDCARQGFPLAPWDGVREFVSRYCGLEFAAPLAPERVFVADPTLGYDGDAEDIAELSGELGRKLFPVGYEFGEAGIVLMDDLGRFFYLHHTGPYFLGRDEAQALSSLMRGDQAELGPGMAAAPPP
ncbi:SUKH-3 domain-containing protein [Streptomyces sp. NBC_00536]|uniref:SUKH-3 domain-containing protein n=1 Tax=Streptomyces sp. NBC_00536 TaxID=2975769 RepID=UPI002E811341|nr:SUKH-3 domain-containing protein [Streptomyces sp. NBC_00536]WUC80519.1 SUKH-3 domain-containing protein [Streptomyces sp. NBC_00536]